MVITCICEENLVLANLFGGDDALGIGLIVQLICGERRCVSVYHNTICIAKLYGHL